MKVDIQAMEESVYILELAKIEEIEIYNTIINEGREFQREQGFIQWSDDYPNKDAIQEDISRKRGYVFKVDGQAAAYMCIDFDGEPAYCNIQGEWRTEGVYAVVHRISISSQFRNRGLAKEIFELIEALCNDKGIKSIRIDTYRLNERMQHVLT